MIRPWWLALCLGAADGLDCGDRAAGSELAGGALTHFEFNRDAFSRPAPVLDAAQLRQFSFGNRVFNTNWTVAPARTEAFDGLGPSFNRISCSGCHLRDGRGRPPLAGERELLSMVLRLSVPGADPHGGPMPVPGYGDQLNDRAIPGVPPEAQVVVRWRERSGRYADGEVFHLRRPEFEVLDPAFGALPADLRISPRVAPAVFGLGLLEAVPESTLLALADPDDVDGDGISGRVNRVFNPLTQSIELGRFGWKAGTASLAQQNLSAAISDLGLSSWAFPQQNCPPPQSACANAQGGGEPELSALFAERLTQYLQMLGVPAQRAPDTASVQRGASHFREFGCAACHRPQLRTGPAAALELLAEQRFSPYTDLLLHDLGAGLSDQRPEYQADGPEWRTAPLWGLGLYPVTNGHQLLLHDGRARGPAEAILWHGGEAEGARERFRTASALERAELLEFLQSL